MDWNDLKYVLETVRNDGVSGAARTLGVNHATVSRRIAALEERLGARLFDRLPAGYAPTEAGLVASEAAKRMEQAGADLERSIGAMDQALKGPLTVTAPQLLIERVMAPILSDFADTYPEIELSLVATNDTLNLARREADVAVRISADPEPSLIGLKVSGQKAAVYAHADLVADLSSNPDQPLNWIRFSHWPVRPGDLMARWPDRRVVLSVDDMIAAIGACRAGIGATRMACFLGDSDPVLRRLPGVEPFDYAPVWVLSHADLRKTPRVAAFRDFMADRLRAERPLFQGARPIIS